MAERVVGGLIAHTVAPNSYDRSKRKGPTETGPHGYAFSGAPLRWSGKRAATAKEAA